MQERRTFRRVPMVTQIQGEAGGMPYIAEARNISVGGMLIRTTQTFAEGQTIQVRFVLPDSTKLISVVCRVQHVSPEAYMGIRFENLTAEDRELIRKYVDAAN